ncbi:hypothetical protein [Citrobacter braakii]|uniref:hypothetical protein n=1 Tax=Citrobacter braakii TaxID=57706 RepID=UPI00242D1E73|nr:hypothetical protein [Citrobacter braakii]WFW69694.1 hypothetical protein NFJ78_03755 [Citrobacter braakii]
MDGAKELAKDMLEAINIDDSGFIAALAKGLISFPVSMGYLAYDFMDTEHHRANADDKYRFARLINKVGFNKELIGQVVGVFINDFSSRLEFSLMVEKIVGDSAGRMIFSELTGVKIGYVISNRLVTAFFSGACIGSFLTLGAEVSRAIYTSRYLAARSPGHYQKLKDMGDLDLLYFLIEDLVSPFEKAIELHNTNEVFLMRFANVFWKVWEV